MLKNKDHGIGEAILAHAGNLQKLQQTDPFCNHITEISQDKRLQVGYPYNLMDGILQRYVDNNKQIFKTTVKSISPVRQLLRQAHDELALNGSSITYMFLRSLYYWKRITTCSVHVCQTMQNMSTKK